MPVLHECPNYRVRYNPANDGDRVVIAFHPWMPAPSMEGEFFGEHFFSTRGISAIGVQPARNDWYQGATMPAVIEAIRKATPGKRRIAYGASMGAYAVINFAEELEFDSLLALGPQFSVDPAKVPFETRWREEAASITFRHDKIDRIKRLRNGWIVYDPLTDDAEHARLILASHDLTPIKIQFCEHHPLLVMYEAGLIESLLHDLVCGDLDPGRFRSAWRAGRRNSSWFWFNLSKKLQARKNLPAAIHAIVEARATNPREKILLDIQHARLLGETGQFDDAIAMLEPHRDHPSDGPGVRWLLEHWTQLRGSGQHAA